MKLRYNWPWPVSGTKNTLEIVINTTLGVEMHKKYQILLTLWFILSYVPPKIFVRIKQSHLNWLNPHRVCAKNKKYFLNLTELVSSICVFIYLYFEMNHAHQFFFIFLFNLKYAHFPAHSLPEYFRWRLFGNTSI